MALIKVTAPPGAARTEVLQLTEIFRARVVDVSDRTLTLCVTGDSGKVQCRRLLLRQRKGETSPAWGRERGKNSWALLSGECQDRTQHQKNNGRRQHNATELRAGRAANQQRMPHPPFPSPLPSTPRCLPPLPATPPRTPPPPPPPPANPLAPTTLACSSSPPLSCPQMAAFQKSLSKFGIIELVRTGRIALKRGEQLFESNLWEDR